MHASWIFPFALQLVDNSPYAKKTVRNASIGSKAPDLQDLSSDICIERLRADLARYRGVPLWLRSVDANLARNLCASQGTFDPILALSSNIVKKDSTYLTCMDDTLRLSVDGNVRR